MQLPFEWIMFNVEYLMSSYFISSYYAGIVNKSKSGTYIHIYIIYIYIFGQNRAEYRNWRNDVTGLHINRIYCHIIALKTQRILITSFKHVLMVKTFFYEILLSCQKQHQIFQASKGFSGRFIKHG